MPHMPYHIPTILPAAQPRNAIQAKVASNPMHITNPAEIGLLCVPGAIVIGGFVRGEVSANAVPAKVVVCSMRRSSMPTSFPPRPRSLPNDADFSIALQQGNDDPLCTKLGRAGHIVAHNLNIDHRG